MNDLQQKLKSYLTTFVPDEDDPEVMRNDKFWYSKDAPFGDFNKEIADPGVIGVFPKGAVGIRGDENFWMLGAFPYEYRNLTIQEVVEVVWPEEATNAEYGEDVYAKKEERDVAAD